MAKADQDRYEKEIAELKNQGFILPKRKRSSFMFFLSKV